jgi:hypothetical protein
LAAGKGQTRESRSTVAEGWTGEPGQRPEMFSQEVLHRLQVEREARREADQSNAALAACAEYRTADAYTVAKMKKENFARANSGRPNAECRRCPRCYSAAHEHESHCGMANDLEPEVLDTVQGRPYTDARSNALFHRSVPWCVRCRLFGHGPEDCIHCMICGRWGHQSQYCRAGNDW